MNSTISKAIEILRFPLACLIVLKHYYIPDIAYPNYGGKLYSIVGVFCSDVITAPVVPLFLIISGYLYFNKCTLVNGFNKELYIKKTKNRIKSLLVPYLLWNLLVFLFFTVIASLTSGSDVMQKDGYKTLADYEFVDIIKNFWALDSTGKPIDGPLWFIRDLFVISLFSPLIFLGIKYLKWFFFSIIIILSYCRISFSVPGIDYSHVLSFSEVYFTLGASIALLNPSLPSKLTEKKYFVFIISISVILCGLLMLSELTSNIALRTPSVWCFRTVAAFAFFAISEQVVHKKFIGLSILSISSFFIFAIHKPILVIIRRIVFASLQPTNEIILIGFILIIPIVTISVSFLLFYFIKRWLPWLKCLNGYRL